MSKIPSPGDIVGVYRIIRERGRGGMAVVLEVVHTETGERRAIKLLLPTHADEDLGRRLIREHRALARLDHENVVKVYEVGSHEGRPYFVMEYLEGKDLSEVAPDWQQLPPPERFRRARKVLIAMARALEHIHSRGLVHRDVTPGNVMLLPDGRVKLMDFGVVKEPGDDLTTVGEVIGTIAYIAPEQIQGGAVDARADLYSMGAVFYLMLTGRRPFNARTLAGYMDKHLHRDVRPPRELVPTIPELADQVCVRLLAKKPSDRFASATHLLHILHASAQPGPGPDQVGWSPSLVGRAAEMARIQAVLHPMFSVQGGDDRQRGSILIIEGADGLGRNRLATEVDLMARQHGLAVTRSRSIGGDQRAFETFRPLYEDLLSEGSAAQPALAATFGDDRAHAGRRVERYAVMKAFADILAASGPRLLILHELQRAERGSIELAEYLIRNLVVAAGRPFAVIVTRTASDDTNDPIHGIVSGERTGKAAERIVLTPLGPSGVEELLLAVVADGPLVRQLAFRIHQEGAGNPFIIAEMIRGLVEAGAISRSSARGARGRLLWTADEVAHSALPVPGSLREVLRERLAPLPPDALHVAAALAVARSDLDTEMLASVCEMNEERVLVAVDALVRARLARERNVDGEERVNLVRNRVRDVVLEQQSADTIRRMHHRLGDVLELRYRRNSEPIVESLARHFALGGIEAKAMPYLIQAAHKLISRTFVSEGLVLLDRALAMEEAARRFYTIDDADRRRAELQLERAQALSHLGQWDEAKVAALASDELARDLGDLRLQARTATELAVQARRQLQLEEAQDHLRRALQLADTLGDKRLQVVPLYEYGAVQWSRADLDAAHDYFTQALASSEAYQDERSLALGTNGLGIIALCRGQSAEARRYFQQSMEVCEKFGMMDRLTATRGNLIEVYHLTGNLKKGLDLADRSLAHAREVDHTFGIALGLKHRALVLTDIGRVAEAIHNAEESLRICRDLGSAEDILGSIIILLRTRLLRGDGPEMNDMLDEALELVEIADTEGFQPILHVWRARVYAHAGDSRAAKEALVHAHQAPGRQWSHQKARLQLNFARAYEAVGDQRRALEAAEASLRLADACNYRYYSLRARQVLARVQPEEAARARHVRVASALARSLSVGLDREDVDQFLDHHGVQRRILPRIELEP